MIELNVRDWDDEDYDDCGNTAIAILKIGHTKIPLCWDCFKELYDEIEQFNRPQYCFQCKHFIMSTSGWNYGGSCCKDEPVSRENAGYYNCKDCMNSCKDFAEETK